MSESPHQNQPDLTDPVEQTEQADQCTATDIQKTRYFSDLALRNKTAWRLHRDRGGALRKRVADKETGQKEWENKDEPWRNVSEHCLVVAGLASFIARLANGVNGKVIFNSLDIRHIERAGILHNWDKRREIERTRGIDDDMLIKKMIDFSQDIGWQLIDQEYWDTDLAYTAYAPFMSGRYLPSRQEERLLLFADQVIMHTDIVRQADRHAETYAHDKRDFRWSEACRDDPHFGGLSLQEAEREAVLQISEQIAGLVGYSLELDDLPLYLENLWQQEIVEGLPRLGGE